VKDHDHITGNYRAPLHNSCNLRYRLLKNIPVFFHNLKNYDSHHIINAIAKFEEVDIDENGNEKPRKRQITVIPLSLEKYLAIYWGRHIVFKDTFQFLSTSLETLVENLRKGGSDNFKILKVIFYFCLCANIFVQQFYFF